MDATAVPPEPGKLSPVQSRLEITAQAVSETMVHGVIRTVGDRHLVVRVLWGLAFLSMLAVFLKQFVDACNRLVDKPTATAIDPSGRGFQFPDVHICAIPMVSASYPSLMTPEERNLTDSLMFSINRTLAAVNRNTLYLAGQLFVGSLPYNLLSRYYGMRKEQTVIGATVMPVNKLLQLNTDIKDLHHHKHLNCLTIRISDPAVRTLLNNVLGYIDLSLYTDASYNQSRIVRYYDGLVDSRGLVFGGFEPLIGSGFRIYFTQEGHYPDEYSASVTLSPGQQHHISLSMVYSELTQEKGQCVDYQPDMQYLDQFTGQSVTYKYDLSACYTKVMNSLFESLFKCFLPGFVPFMYSSRNLTICNSLAMLTGNNASANSIMSKIEFLNGFSNGRFLHDLVDSIKNMTEICRTQQPCQDVKYAASLSSILFPMRHAVTNEIRQIFKNMSNDRLKDNYTIPGRVWMQKLLETLENVTSYSAELESDFVQAVSENVMRVQIAGGEVTSAVFKQNISYKLNDLVAGVGGLLGLYMGGSILSLVEIMELIVFLIKGRRIVSSSGAFKPEEAQQFQGQQMQLSDVNNSRTEAI